MKEGSSRIERRPSALLCVDRAGTHVGRLVMVAVLVLFSLLESRAVTSGGWVPVSAPDTPLNLKNIVVGNGRLVAVGGYGTLNGAAGVILTSVDGDQWSVALSSDSKGFSYGFDAIRGLLAFGNGVFVAMHSSTTDQPCFISGDGLTWTRGGTVPDVVRSIVFMNGLFVAQGQFSVFTSPDGITWKVHENPFAQRSVGVAAHGGGDYLLVPDIFSDDCAVTRDWKTWTRGKLPAMRGGYNRALAYANGRFLLMESPSGSPCLTSVDGVMWTVSPSPVTESHQGFVRGEDAVFIHVVDDTFWLLSHDSVSGQSVIRTSRDGVNWTLLTRQAPNFSAVTKVGSRLYAVGPRGGRYTSLDGVIWTSNKLTENSIASITFGGARWVLTDVEGHVFTSEDTRSWNHHGQLLPRLSDTPYVKVRKVVYGDGVFVAVSTDNTLATSADGVSWTTATSTLNDDRWQALACGNGVFVASAFSGRKAISKDGYQWEYSWPAGPAVQTLTFGRDRFVGISYSGEVASSGDGTVWTTTKPGFVVAGVSDGVYADEKFCVVGWSGLAMVSSDGGTAWSQTAGEVPAGGFGNDHLKSVIWNGDRLLAVGTYGRVTWSFDGNTWSSNQGIFGYNIPELTCLATDGVQTLAGGTNGLMLRLAGSESLFSLAPQSRSSSLGFDIVLTVVIDAGSGKTPVQWTFNGEPLAMGTNYTFTVNLVTPSKAGLYSAVATSNGGNVATEPSIVGVTANEKIVGDAAEVGANIYVTANENTFDQVLLAGAAASVKADHTLNQITRISFVDLDDDIVQVEFSGPGTLTLALDESRGPNPPLNYNQNTSYMKGHARIVVTGATRATNVSVFSVGKATAVNQSLFKDDVSYDGIADIAYIAILSDTGEFGGVRTGNVHYFARTGYTGLYAPGVTFTGPVVLGDLTAFDNAAPVIVTGGLGECRIAGGALQQPNNAKINVRGVQRVILQDGADSHGGVIHKSANQGVFWADGKDVTNLLLRP